MRPEYRDYMRAGSRGRCGNTTEHKTHLEYQTLVSDPVPSRTWACRTRGAPR